MLNYTSSNPNTTFERVQGIRTSASNVYGGITTFDTQGHVCAGIRKAPGDPEDKGHNFVPNGDGTYTCTICGLTISEEDYLDGNFLPEISTSPIECDWKAILFLSALAGWYAMHKVRSGKKGNKNELIAVL
jgi:hypothetical protein